MPMMRETSVEMRPTASEMRPPCRTRASMSRPALSVPIGCVQENEPSGAVSGGNDFTRVESAGVVVFLEAVAPFVALGAENEAGMIGENNAIPATGSPFLLLS